MPNLQEFRNQLISVDNKIPGTAPKDIPRLFEYVPLEIFGAIQIDRPAWIPNLLAWLPKMAPDEVQNSWTGSSGHELLKSTVSFVRIVTAAYAYLTGNSLRTANVLDFGCGWGRIVRLLYKYVPATQIYGVDPMETSLKHCADAGVHGTILKSDFVPRTLPIPRTNRFDLILAFSVFTHLSEKVTRISLNTLAAHLSPNGLLAITIRPREYWPYIEPRNPHLSVATANRLVAQHDERGFAFEPHNREKIEGEVTFGDTSMTIEYLARITDRLKIVGLDWSTIDPMQIIVFLKNSKSSEGRRLS